MNTVPTSNAALALQHLARATPQIKDWLTQARAKGHQGPCMDHAESAIRLCGEISAAFTLSVYVRNVYGNECIYAADAEQARILRALTSSKTLLPSHVEALTALGFTFQQVPDPKAPKLGAELFALGVSSLRSSNPGDLSPR